MPNMSQPSDKPRTVRDIRAEKERKRGKLNNKIRIYNISKLQQISIQLYGANSKLVRYQQAIHIAPGRHADLPSDRLISAQIDNLKKQGFISTHKIDTSK
jgi:hypothetical protein